MDMTVVRSGFLLMILRTIALVLRVGLVVEAMVKMLRGNTLEAESLLELGPKSKQHATGVSLFTERERDRERERDSEASKPLKALFLGILLGERADAAFGGLGASTALALLFLCFCHTQLLHCSLLFAGVHPTWRRSPPSPGLPGSRRAALASTSAQSL